jgi:tRNA (guanine-N7-)-methyltransferase
MRCWPLCRKNKLICKTMLQHPHAYPADPNRLYGRRKGRPLRMRKSGLMQTLLPHLQITLPAAGMVDPATWFAAVPQALWLEIGFGGGEHLAAQAARNPHIGMVGCEPFANGVASLLDHIDRDALGNIRIYQDNARRLLTQLPPASVARIYLLFADPWPKKRHADRRFIQPDSLQAMARVLQPGGWLTLATDDPTLQAWTTEHMLATPDFSPRQAHGHGISPLRPEGWLPTRYEAKALQAGRTPLYYEFRRNAS